MDDGARIHPEEAVRVPPAQIQILTDQTDLEMRYPDLSCFKKEGWSKLSYQTPRGSIPRQGTYDEGTRDL
jgi:hypothetical protein